MIKTLSTRKFLLFVSLAAIILGLVFFLTPFDNSSSQIVINDKGIKIKSEIKVGEVLLKVEISDEVNEWRQGLSGREKLSEVDPAMLFVFPSSAPREFWMKDMKFALDFLWINQNKIVEIDQNIPSPSSGSLDTARVRPLEPVDMVLEVPAGFVAQNQVKVGDMVTGVDNNK
ncbi:MAG: DUF192 domain-containing protein [Patescibacteria group bacterium]